MGNPTQPPAPRLCNEIASDLLDSNGKTSFERVLRDDFVAAE